MERGGLARFAGMLREHAAQDVTLDDVHGDRLFYDTVNAPDAARFAIDFCAGTTAVLEANGTAMPIAHLRRAAHNTTLTRALHNHAL